MDPTTDRPLSGQDALITGASRGIGRATAVALAAAGADVALCARSEVGLAETAAQIETLGARALPLPADVTEAEQVARTVAQCEEVLGPLDLLVNNAGVGGVGAPVWDADIDAWWQTMRVNLLGPFLFARAVLPSMRRRGRGRIVNVGSYAGVRPTPGNSAYSASKAALLRFSDSLAAEVAADGVVVFAMSPGLVHTDMTAAVPYLQSLPADAYTPISAGADLIVRLAGGDADGLGGMLIHALDDLDALITDAEALRAAGRYQLRLWRGLDESEPV